MRYPRYEWTTPDGFSLALNDGQQSIVMTALGIGPPPVDIQQVEPAARHGAIYIHSRLGPRLIQLELAMMHDSWDALTTWNQALIARFNPLTETRSQLGALAVTLTPGAPTYAIDGTLQGPVDHQLRRGGYQRVSLPIWCPNPLWRKVPGQVATISLTSSGLSVPIAVPVSLSANVLDTTVTNDGHMSSPVRITVAGPVSDPTIRNHTVDQEVSFQMTVPQGFELVVDTGQFTAVLRDQAGIEPDLNVLNLMTPQSEMWDLAIGANTVIGEASSGSVNVIVRYYQRFLGIDL